MNLKKAGAVLFAGYLLTRATIDRKRHTSFASKLALITGGSRGLGLVLARQLVEEGARVAFCARDIEEVESAERDLRGRSKDRDSVKGFVCDLTRAESIEPLVMAVKEWGGAVDLLVNNAGTIVVGPEATMTEEDYRTSLDLHMWAPLRLIREVVPVMRARGGGRIINITSVGGLVSVPHLTPYCVGKSAAVALSEGLRAELMRDNIYVTTVCPGLLRTGSHLHARFKGQFRVEQTLFTVANANPVLSIGAERAARAILRAAERGRARLTLTWPARIGAVMEALAPELAADAGAALTAALPKAIGPSRVVRSGRRSGSPLSPSILTTLSDSAALRNNE